MTEQVINKAISVRAPWWWFILHAGKDIENRDWPTDFRGTVYVHASKWWSNTTVIDDARTALDCCRQTESVSTIEMARNTMKKYGGSIVGTVDIIDCVQSSTSPWFFGRHGFVLSNPVAFARPVPCKGALGFFHVPDGVRAQLG